MALPRLEAGTVFRILGEEIGAAQRPVLQCMGETRPDPAIERVAGEADVCKNICVSATGAFTGLPVHRDQASGQCYGRWRAEISPWPQRQRELGVGPPGNAAERAHSFQTADPGHLCAIGGLHHSEPPEPEDKGQQVPSTDLLALHRISSSVGDSLVPARACFARHACCADAVLPRHNCQASVIMFHHTTAPGSILGLSQQHCAHSSVQSMVDTALCRVLWTWLCPHTCGQSHVPGLSVVVTTSRCSSLAVRSRAWATTTPAARQHPPSRQLTPGLPATAGCR